MKVGFDIDGTVAVHAAVLGPIMRALRAAGHEVHIVTGDPANRADAAHLAMRGQQLADLGLGDAYDHLFVARYPWWDQKAAYAQSVGLALLIDDDPRNCAAITRAGLLALQVTGHV